jgi:heat shock protein HslJ
LVNQHLDLKSILKFMKEVNMKKTILFTFLILAMLLSACSAGQSTPTAQPTTVPPTEQPLEPTTAPEVVEVAAPVGSATVGKGDLTGTTWTWVAFTDPMQQFNVENPSNYTLTFQEDGTVNIVADCNNAMGSYNLDGSSLTIEVGPMTMAACPPDSRSDDFVKYLGFAAIYFFQDGDLFIDLFADGGTMRFSSSSGSEAGNDPFSALGIDITGEPFSGELFLGGGDERWLDPTLISTLGGTSEGPGVNATSLGTGCQFFVPLRPDVAINWQAEDNVDMLRFFFLSMGDPSLMLVTPSGEVLCSDDLNPLALDPYIEVTNPEAGRYAAFMGSYEGDAVYPGFLVVTSHDINPTTMDLAQLFPREVDPRAVPQPLSLDVLKLDSPDAATPAGGKLAASNLPYTQQFTAGGEIGAFNLEQPNELCTGFISAAPTFRFDWTEPADQLVMFFESNVDTTLQVLAPDGNYYCDDDFQGSENINPWLKLAAANGTYHVWVGSFSLDTQAAGTLTITGDANASPAVLTSQDIQN